MKFLAFILAVVLLVSPLSACGEPVVIHGDSEIYSKRDIDKAADEVMDRFGSMRGCKMYSLTYAGDEVSKGNIEYVNSLAKDGVEYDECLVFESVFRSPLRGGGAWEPNEIYTWSWYLARTKDGRWDLLTWGYA